MKLGKSSKDSRRPDQVRVGRSMALLAATATVVVTAVYWEPLTQPFPNHSFLWGLFAEPPMSGVGRITLMFLVFLFAAMCLGLPLSGRLIKKASKEGIEPDPPVSPEAKATENLSKRVIDLEESQKKLIEAHRESGDGE